MDLEWDQYKLLNAEEREEYKYKFGDTSHDSVFWFAAKSLFMFTLFFLVVVGIGVTTYTLPGIEDSNRAM